MSENKVIEAVNAQVVFASAFEDGSGIKIAAMSDTGDAGTMNIRTKKYVDGSRPAKYVDDEETAAKALETVQKLGATSLETAVEEINAAITSGGVTLEEVYFNDGRVTFNKPLVRTVYTKFNDRKLAKSLEGERETTPFEEYNGYRFNLGIEVDGKIYRVSQLAYAETDDEDEVALPLTYATAEINNYRDNLKNGAIPENMVENIQNVVARLVDTARTKKIEDISEFIGEDFETEYLTNGKTLTGTIKVEKTPFVDNDGNAIYYSKLIIAKP